MLESQLPLSKLHFGACVLRYAAQARRSEMITTAKAFDFVRWASLIWVCFWFSVNTWVWGWQNMLHLCDVGLVLACVGLWMRQPLLVSSQVLGAPLVGVLWGLDVSWRLITGHHLVGGTEYMWDTNYPLWVRLLSCFHLALPVILLWALRILGYDRRALAFQSAVTAVLLLFSRFLSADLNMNYAYKDPLLHRTWGAAPIHLAVILSGCVLIFYLPMHLLLLRVFPKTGPAQ